MTSVALRTDRTYPNYLGIATDAVLAFDRIEGELAAAGIDRASLPDLRCQRFNQYSIATVFSGMCLEAFLYDYAAHVFGDAFVKEHLDNLRFLSKCETYPRLIAGKPIDKGGPMWVAVRGLKEERDDLVHWKSAAPHPDIDVENQREQKRAEAFSVLAVTLLQVYSALRLFAVELTRLHAATRIEHPFPDLFLREAENANRIVQQRAAHLPLARGRAS